MTRFIQLIIFTSFLAAMSFVACTQTGPQTESTQEQHTEHVTEKHTDAATKDVKVERPPEPQPEPTPEKTTRCLTPKALGAGPYFKDITKEVGLGEDGIKAYGTKITSADLDQDGYPDLIIHGNEAKRDDWTASPPVRYRWVLYNRPHPSIEGKRIFVDQTKESGYAQTRDPKVLGRASHFALYADVNNDGRLDIFSAAKSDANKPNEDHTDRSRVLLQDEKGTFSFATGATDITPSASQLWSTTSATFLDYDRDGIIDIFVGFWYKNYGRSYEALQDRLYKGRGDGTFEDVTAKTGLTTLPFQQGYKNGTNHKPTYGVTSCDVNDDGYTDLLVSAYGRQYNMLYLNNGRGSFTELGRPSGFAGDEQRDPKDNEFYRCFCAAYPIQCPAGVPKPRIQCSNPPPWNNTLDGHPFRLNGNTFTTVCGDINRDGKNDLYNTEIRHWHIGSSSDPTQLLLNITSGSTIKFKRMAPQTVGMSRPKTGSWNQGDLMAAFLDFDNDGREDIYLCNSDYPFTYGHLFHQQTPKADGTPTFTDIAKKAGVDHARAVGVTAIDIDNDGDLDLVIGSSRARCKAAEGCPWKVNEVRVYENLVGQDTNWLKISLRGKGKGGTNKMGIGSTIWVTAGGVTQMKEISGGYGVSGQQHGLVAHFGLGKHCTIEKITVRWANSSRGRQVFENIQGNQHIQINEGVDTLTTR